ncbi:MAG: RES family NAD+ phosphorylase [Nitrospirota bacterium]|jgi:RES domain-containing protein
MNVYRLIWAEHIKKILAGSGARNRWSLEGTIVVYTAESRALACVEYLVHVPVAIIPKNLKIATIEIPDDILPKEITISALPKNWRSYNPPPLELAELGTKWAKSEETLLLRVPSAVVEHEYNIIINPSHPDIKSIAVKQVEDFIYDERLIKRH